MCNKKRVNVLSVKLIRAGIMKGNKTITGEQVPSFEELLSEVLGKASKLGLERTSPRKAKCVIRVFRTTNHKDESRTCYAYGYEPFIKRLTRFSNDDYDLDFEKCSIITWFDYDAPVVIFPEFVDLYFK